MTKTPRLTLSGISKRFPECVANDHLDELFEICDHIAVIAKGRLSPPRAVADASLEEFGQWMSGLFERSAKNAAKEPDNHGA